MIVAGAKKYEGKNINFDQIAKDILKTQPQRPGDVQDMIAYVKIFGGLPDGSFVSDLSRLLNMYMPSDRVVSGEFFKWLASLKFPVDFMPANFVTAVLFRHGSAKTGVQDGISRYISKNDVNLLTTTKKETEIKEANRILARAKTLFGESTEGLKSRTELMNDIVDLILNKDPKRFEGQTVESISKKCIDKVFGETVEVGESSSSQGTLNVVLYDEQGDAAGVGRSTLVNKGFSLGMYVTQKKDNNRGTLQRKILSINDNGNVKLGTVGPNGELAVDVNDVMQTEIVDHSKFTEPYKIVTKIEFLPQYPANDIKNDTDNVNMELRCVLFSAVLCLSRKYDPPDARIMMKPAGGVYAQKVFAVGEYVCVPVCHFSSIARKEAKHGDGTSHAECKVGDHEFVIANERSSEKCASQFWSIRIGSDKKGCNCQIEMKDTRNRKPTVEPKNMNEIQTTAIGCIVNYKQIEVNEEIVVYKPSIKKREQGSKPVRVVLESRAVAAKKAKLA